MVKIDSTGNKVWDKTLGGDYLDYLFSMAHTNDGGIIAAGQSYSGATGDKSEPNHDATQAGSDYWIIKLDGQGNVQWDRTYGASQVEQLSKVSPTSDSGFLLSGESYSPVDGDKSEPNLGMEQTWVVKIDSVGNIIWDKTIFTTGHDELGTAIEVSPLCFVAVNYTAADTGGYKSQMSWGVGDYWMVKVCENDPTGLSENSPLSNHVSLHPNPANEYIHISMTDEMTGRVMLQIFDVTGREVHAGEIVNPDWTKGINFDVSRLQNGYYILKLTGKSGAAKSAAFIKG
jgi:Secretion system C-terminal sorting domain